MQILVPIKDMDKRMKLKIRLTFQLDENLNFNLLFACERDEYRWQVVKLKSRAAIVKIDPPK